MPAENVPVAPRWPWKRMAVVSLAALLFVVAAAPTVIAWTPLRNRVLGMVFAKVNGQVVANSASLGWFSGTVLYGVTVRDAGGQVVLEVERLALPQKTVVGLIFAGNDLGPVECDQPRVHVTADAQGVNLARVFGTFLDKPKEEKATLASLLLRGGNLVFVNSATGTEVTLAEIGADLDSLHPHEVARFNISAKLTIVKPGDLGLYQPPVTIAGEGQLDPQADELRLEALTIKPKVGPLAIAAQGRVTRLASAPKLELTGDVTYDLPQLAERVRPFVGGDLQLDGQGTRQFQVAGPLGAVLDAASQTARAEPAGESPGEPRRESPFRLAAWKQPGEAASTPDASAAPQDSAYPAIPGLPMRPQARPPAPAPATVPALQWLTGLEGKADLGWNRAAAFGVHVGQASLQGRLADGWLHLVTGQVQVNEGQVDLRTRLHIAGSTPVLVVEPGRLVHHVRITPEACAQGLRFIAPVMAEATETTGEFSLDVIDCQIPLGPGQPVLKGELTIHSVDVGPGPLLIEVAKLLRMENVRMRVIDQSAIYFELVDNRVYHEGFEFQLGDLKIRSRGYVGLDESLALVLEVPFIDYLLPPGPLGQHLRGKSILVPVSGTTKKPKIDVKEIARVNMAVLGGGGGGQGGVLEGLLGGPIDGEAVTDMISELLERRQQARAAREADPQQPLAERPVLNFLRDRLKKRLGRPGDPSVPPVPPVPAPDVPKGPPVVPPGPPKPPLPPGPREF